MDNIPNILMIKGSIKYRSTRKKISKSLKSNIAVHPFVIIAILAALAVVVWITMFFLFRVL